MLFSWDRVTYDKRKLTWGKPSNSSPPLLLTPPCPAFPKAGHSTRFTSDPAFQPDLQTGSQTNFLLFINYSVTLVVWQHQIVYLLPTRGPSFFYQHSSLWGLADGMLWHHRQTMFHTYVYYICKPHYCTSSAVRKLPWWTHALGDWTRWSQPCSLGNGSKAPSS